MKSDSNQKPPDDNRSLKIPLLLNVGLILLLALLAHGFSSFNTPNHYDEGEAALVLFFLLVGLFLLDVVAVFVALLLGKRPWVRGFLLAGLLVFLVGLGTCGYSVEHLHLGGN
ncbi:hypothetical protein [Hymenobacter terrenus]|uniref:hypothetical protein n=1 Tax=Hymenobacter terrenus TaxID=1629124 RepID=UPI000619C0F5|nr:hypothetical protein [Hymenobacter terrenus]